MDVKFTFDTHLLVEEIVQKVVKELKPLLMKGQDEDIFFDVKGLSQYLGVSPDWIYKKTALREIPFIKLGGGLIKFKKNQIDKWLSEQNVKPLPALNLVRTRKMAS